MTDETKKKIKTFLETLVYQIEKNGLMQYDRIHNGNTWVLERAKDLLNQIKQESEEQK